VGRFLANLISYILHPLLMPTLLLLILLFFLPQSLQPVSGKIALLIILLVFITTFIIPALSILGLRSTTTITSVKLRNRTERVLPFSFITIFYGITTYLFHSKIEINDTILSIFIGASVLVALLTIITIFFKISVHSAGAGCMLGFLLSIMLIFPEHNLMWALIIIVLITGLILSARLYLNAHTPIEVYSGFALGLFISFFSLYFLA
jgi:hypothetical protein